MLGKFFECEADKNGKYYRVIHTVKEYDDGKRFPMDEAIDKIHKEAYHAVQVLAGINKGDPTYNENQDIDSYKKTM